MHLTHFIFNLGLVQEGETSGGGGGGSLCSCLGKKKQPVSLQEIDRIEAAFR